MLLHKPRGQMSESLLMSAFVILSGGLQDAYTYLCRGGVFANVLLQERCRQLLEKEGFAVYVNEQVPGNDGGLSLGQAWLAGRLENEEVTGCALRCPEG